MDLVTKDRYSEVNFTIFCDFFVIQHVLSDVYFCDVRLRMVGLPRAEQLDVRLLDFIVILSIYTGTCLAFVCIILI